MAAACVDTRPHPEVLEVDPTGDETFLLLSSSSSWDMTDASVFSQIVSRYRTWLDENTSSMIASGRQSVQEKEKGGSAPSSQPPSRTGTPQPAGAGNDVSDDKTVRQLTAHVVDVRRLASALSTFFDSSIQESIPQPSSAATEDAPQPKGQLLRL